eukprot:scaffold17121_cov64-Phaeocystis_antarctica.AAC.3
MSEAASREARPECAGGGTHDSMHEAVSRDERHEDNAPGAALHARFAVTLGWPAVLSSTHAVAPPHTQNTHASTVRGSLTYSAHALALTLALTLGLNLGLGLGLTLGLDLTLARRLDYACRLECTCRRRHHLCGLFGTPAQLGARKIHRLAAVPSAGRGQAHGIPG